MTVPPLSQGLNDRLPPPRPLPYLKVWICRCVRPMKSPQPGLLDESIFLSLVKLVFRIHFFIKPMVVTEPTVPSTRPLSLGLKLYPSNMQRMRNEDLTRFMQSFLSAPKWSKRKKGSDSRVHSLQSHHRLLSGLT